MIHDGYVLVSFRIVRTRSCTAEAHHRGVPHQHLVPDSDVEVIPGLVLGQLEQSDGDCHRLGLRVIERGAPRGPAPFASGLRPVRLQDLQRAFRAAIFDERHELSHSETVEGNLKTNKP